MMLKELRKALRRARAPRFAAKTRVDTPFGLGTVEGQEGNAGTKFIVRLDRPFELRQGSPVERSAFFDFEMRDAA
jgi:hypothetical protein